MTGKQREEALSICGRRRRSGAPRRDVVLPLRAQDL